MGRGALTGDRRTADPRAALFRIGDLSVGFDRRVILEELTFELPQRGLVALLGPAGVGKTTLLRTLGRWNDALPSFWARGEILLGGRNLLHERSLEEVHAAVPLLAQKARLYTATVQDNAIAEIRGDSPLTVRQKRELAHEALAPLGLWAGFEPVLNEAVISLSIGRQRQLSIARLTAGGALCLLADEPLRDISPAEADAVGRLLLRLAESRAIVMVTHNQQEARAMSDLVCLVAAGRLIEATPAREFFSAPRSDLGSQFLRTGNCWPSEARRPPRPTRGAPPPRSAAAVPPPSFHWVIRDRLGGMQRPGLLGDERADLEAIAALGVRVLVTLTEEPFDATVLASHGIRSVHFPIPDMGAPSLEEAARLCERVSAWIDEGTPVALHCKAGLGRTGTMLACTLVERGVDPVSAVDRVRCVNFRYIQSEEQLAFVSRFAAHLEAVREPSQ